MPTLWGHIRIVALFFAPTFVGIKRPALSSGTNYVGTKNQCPQFCFDPTGNSTWEYNSIVMWAHIEKGMWGQNRTVASVWGHNSIVL